MSKANEIGVGARVRSYDFPGMRDNCYVEGYVMGFKDLEGCRRYHIAVTMAVFNGARLLDGEFPTDVFPPVNGTPTWSGEETNGVELLKPARGPYRG